MVSDDTNTDIVPLEQLHNVVHLWNACKNYDNWVKDSSCSYSVTSGFTKIGNGFLTSNLTVKILGGSTTDVVVTPDTAATVVLLLQSIICDYCYRNYC